MENYKLITTTGEDKSSETIFILGRIDCILIEEQQTIVTIINDENKNQMFELIAKINSDDISHISIEAIQSRGSEVSFLISGPHEIFCRLEKPLL